jgi:hypothetical protein
VSETVYVLGFGKVELARTKSKEYDWTVPLAVLLGKEPESTWVRVLGVAPILSWFTPIVGAQAE